MKKIIRLGLENSKDNLADELWEWLREKGYVKKGNFDYVDKEIQLIIEVIEE